MGFLPIFSLFLGAFILLCFPRFRELFMTKVTTKFDVPNMELYSDLDNCRRIISGQMLEQDSFLTFFESRAFPNRRLVEAFGLDNAFTSTDEAHCKKFVRLAQRLVKVRDGMWKIYMSSAFLIINDRLELKTSNIGDDTLLVPLVQSTVFQFVMQIISPDEPPQFGIAASTTIVRKINSLWIASKMFPRKDMSEDRRTLQRELLKVLGQRDGMLGTNPLNLIIPAYEALWRVVLRCYLEVLYRGGKERRPWQDLFLDFCANTTKSTFQNSSSSISVKHIVNEALRLYPPTKRIYRQENPDENDQRPRIVAANVLYLQRDPKIWGTTAMLFNPTRWRSGTKEQNDVRQEAFLAFGCNPHKCPAYNTGPVLIAILVAALIRKTRDQFDLVALNQEDSVDGIEPLDSNRNAFTSLRLRRLSSFQDNS